MKLFIALSLLLTSAAYACECGEEVKDDRSVVETLLKRVLGSDIKIKTDEWGDFETVWLRAHLTILDRITAMGEMRGSSCEYTGPNNEVLFMCQPKYISEYRYSITHPKFGECTADLKVTTTVKSAKAVLLKHTCR